MRSKGLHFEKIALQYLRKRGLRPLTSNYTSKLGEIDLIMYDDEILVFIEVRYRKNDSHGSALESVTASKQRRIANSAKLFLRERNLWQTRCRFDVVSINEGLNQSPVITWIKSAFYVYE